MVKLTNSMELCGVYPSGWDKGQWRDFVNTAMNLLRNYRLLKKDHILRN
jgi:hypothetical protein